MTSSSSPGISLMMEGLSYIAGTEVPMVLVNVMRAGPGLGNIGPAQSDYNQIVHGGGHGDYRNIVLAPASIQESIDLTVLAFDLAEKYRTIAAVLTDGSLGQMMEPGELPPMRRMHTTHPDWAATGAVGRKPNILSSIYLDPPDEERYNLKIMQKWQQIEANEVRYKAYNLEDARFAVVGFGSAGRVALSAVHAARSEGIPVGLLRPITVSPFPEQALLDLSEKVESILVVEMNCGQMLDDVMRITHGRVPVEFYGRVGGVTPFPDEILEEIHRLAAGRLAFDGRPRDRWLKLMLERNR
jgi:2-oxoglutarate ferredoxin oxidoreductase subunit alpha